MAHADYNCCMICDDKMEYSNDAKTKESICFGCIEKIMDMGLKITTPDRFIKFVNENSKVEVIKILRKIDFRFCYYPNCIDAAVYKKGIIQDYNRKVQSCRGK